MDIEENINKLISLGYLAQNPTVVFLKHQLVDNPFFNSYLKENVIGEVVEINSEKYCPDFTPLAKWSSDGKRDRKLIFIICISDFIDFTSRDLLEIKRQLNSLFVSFTQSVEGCELLTYGSDEMLKNSSMLPHYLESAAETGFIAQKSDLNSKSAHSGYIWFLFAKKQIAIHLAKASDIDSLDCLEKRSLPEFLRATKVQLGLRIKNNPDGVYIVSVNDGVIAALYTQRINKESTIFKMKYSEIESFHKNNGDIVQLIFILVDPDYQALGVANELLFFVLTHNFCKQYITKILAVSRCAGYTPKKGSYEAYIHKVNKRGFSYDPILNMHSNYGAKIIDKVPGFRDLDTQNLGNGVLVQYNYNEWLKSI